MHGFKVVAGILAGVMLAAVARGQALKVLAIGDSLTEEYRFETVFSGPQSNPVDANTKNWVELLSARRSGDVTFGSYEANLGRYPDFRDGGYKYNYGVPSFTTVNWIDVIESTIADSVSGDPYRTLCFSTKTALGRHIRDDGIGVVVIFLGGNDLKSDYDGIFKDADPPALLAEAVQNIGEIHAFVRSNHATVPVVICTFPDIGATPEVSGKYTDPALRIRARQRIADANAAVIAKAAQLGAQVARVDSLTDRIFDETPFQINGTVFQYPPHPDNPPDHLFCHDGFHPSTVGQALIANQIIDAINRSTGRSIPPMPNREILGTVLGLDPDQPYLDWAGAAGGMTENPDGDVAPNLVEFLLGTSPFSAGSPFVHSADGALSFKPLAEPMRFADLRVLESETLGNDWTVVPSGRISVGGDGTWTVAPNGDPANFYRLEAVTKP